MEAEADSRLSVALRNLTTLKTKIIDTAQLVQLFHQRDADIHFHLQFIHLIVIT